MRFAAAASSRTFPPLSAVSISSWARSTGNARRLRRRSVPSGEFDVIVNAAVMPPSKTPLVSQHRAGDCQDFLIGHRQHHADPRALFGYQLSLQAGPDGPNDHAVLIQEPKDNRSAVLF